MDILPHYEKFVIASMKTRGLQLLISAIVTWNAAYISHEIKTLRTNDTHIPEKYIQHISPLR
ncbi:hypothetical protein BLD50_05075 [Bacillus cereus]|nr:hypothetical protein BLD50_05075 [Bacillus cereus]